jgi:aerobic-type carbon monoxide dehydrogenase small subunit (CoxS/CutS family)
MRHEITIRINGRDEELEVSSNETLLDALRDRLKLYGAREGCGVSVCGACTVLLDGRPVSSCVTLAALADGKDVQTVEGLATDGALHPLQEEIWSRGASQCGYCTSGIILAAKFVLEENPHATREQIVDELSGNICRCTGYKKIVEAILAARDRLAARG